MQPEDENLLLNLIGERIRELRKEAGYTSQETFAYDAEIPRALYGRFEKGTTMTVVSLYKIICAHNITFEEFFSSGFGQLPIDKPKGK
jgi:DNA-binding XRE family transcriptional regulator